MLLGGLSPPIFSNKPPGESRYDVEKHFVPVMPHSSVEIYRRSDFIHASVRRCEKITFSESTLFPAHRVVGDWRSFRAEPLLLNYVA
jgi:hypothetical protein